MDTVDTKYPVSARIPDWIQIFVKVDKRIPDWIQNFVRVDTGYRIGYRFFSKWIQDTGLDTKFCQNGYRIPDWIHKMFQNIGSISKMKL